MRDNSKKCEFCINYDASVEQCQNCNFKYNEEYNPWAKDNWDIFSLNEEDGWEHIQVLDRLHYKDIDCLFVDIWYDNNIMLIIGAKRVYKIADALNIHNEVVYDDSEHGLVIVNLFQEKYLRGELE